MQSLGLNFKCMHKDNIKSQNGSEPQLFLNDTLRMILQFVCKTWKLMELFYKRSKKRRYSTCRKLLCLLDEGVLFKSFSLSSQMGLHPLTRD